MKSGYRVYWTKHALEELAQTVEYLEKNFSEKEINRLAKKVESITEMLSRHPEMFPASERKNVRKAVILKYNTLYYRVKNDTVEILSFFSNRQNPKKRRIR